MTSSSKTIFDDGDYVEYKISSQNDENLFSLINKEIELTNAELTSLEGSIEKLTNQADKFDYMVAVASGLIAASVDVFFVGEIASFKSTNHEGSIFIENFIIKIAQLLGCKEENLDLVKAVSYLEKYKSAGDAVKNSFGGPAYHHLFDFTHHFSLVGLLFSLLSQFTGKVYGIDKNGVFKIESVPEKYKDRIGNDFYQKIVFGTINWFYHLVSDMAGAPSTIRKGGYGTGLPGPILSLLTLLSGLPFFKSSENQNRFFEYIKDIFDGELSVRGDLRTEIGLYKEISKQSIPVILNECFVRIFYFIRKLYVEIKQNDVRSFSDFSKISLKKLTPFNNRTIVRLITVSSGVFTALDLADATIRASVKTKFNYYNPEFYLQIGLRVNYLGLTRFTLACEAEINMAIQLEHNRNERIAVMNKNIRLLNARNLYMVADTWLNLNDLNIKSVLLCKKQIDVVKKIYDQSQKMKCNEKRIKKDLTIIKKKNTKLSRLLNKASEGLVI